MGGIQYAIGQFQIQYLIQQNFKQTVQKLDMDGIFSTPDEQSYPLQQSQPSFSYRQLLTRAEQAMIQRAIELSQQQEIRNTYSSKNQLEPKYRKMIPNLKMKKSHQDCTVCLEKYAEGEIIKLLPCSHILHRECAKNWLKVNKTCPVCRLDLEAHYKKAQAKQAKQDKLEGQKINRKALKV